MHGTGVEAMILARIEATPRERRSVATDADGTLWSGDAGDALYVALLEKRGFSEMALRYLCDEARVRGLVDVAADGYAAARAIHRSWLRGDIDDKSNCDIQARALGGLKLQQLRDHGSAVARDIASTVRSPVRDVVARAAAAGARVTVVTASLGLLVEQCLAAAGIPFHRVAGARLETVDGVTTTSLDGPVPMFREKVAALRAGDRWPATIGMGDGHWDAEFLREVGLAVLVHPRAGLRAAMESAPNAVTWEPA